VRKGGRRDALAINPQTAARLHGCAPISISPATATTSTASCCVPTASARTNAGRWPGRFVPLLPHSEPYAAVLMTQAGNSPEQRTRQ
jgi:hypothetical protein